MSTQSTPQSPDPAHLRELYGRLCTAYHAIDDFRSKLLGFLPLVSGLSIWGLILEEKIKEKHLDEIGLLGATITLALALYELKGIQKCVGIIKQGQALEKKIWPGQGEQGPGLFGRLASDGPLWPIVTEPAASALIYGAVLGSWVYVAKGMCPEYIRSALWAGGGVTGLMYLYWLYIKEIRSRLLPVVNAFSTRIRNLWKKQKSDSNNG
ncbi:MAG: hypothetical protein NW241_15530 [Bacteroidia bacterium]|nr:hypothetical protein [Bacteroidia bacterium]